MARSTVQCPIDAATKEWIDRRWVWLEQQFGSKTLREANVILPRAEFFPDAFSGSEENAEQMLRRVCDYMGIDADKTQLFLYEDRNPVHEGRWRQGTSGLYREESGVFEIWLEASNLTDPVGMIGTLAHEVAHIHLLGHGRISDEEEDHEPLTDLLTVFLGMGVFTANSVIHEHYWNSGHFSGWSMGRRGYLSMPMYGYALALFARSRGENNPSWAKQLRPDVRAAFKQAIKVLDTPEENRCYPVNASQPAEDAEHEDRDQQDGSDESLEGLSVDENIADEIAGETDYEEPDAEELYKDDHDAEDGEPTRLETMARRIVGWSYVVFFTVLAGGLLGLIVGEMLGKLVSDNRLGEMCATVGAILLPIYVVWRVRRGRSDE